MCRIKALYDHFALLSLPPCPAAYLFHQLVAALMGSEIGEIEHIVGVQDTDQADIIKIKSFGDHLCTDQHLYPSFFKIVNDALMGIFRAGRIEVHATNGRFWENVSQLLLHLLRPESFHEDASALALRACYRHVFRIAAVVALDLIFLLMIG